MTNIDCFERPNPLETFWIGDLPPDLLAYALNFVGNGTCWADGVSGKVDLDSLLESLFRLKSGLPPKQGDRLLRVRGDIEFHVCMVDEADGYIHVKHWSGNGGGDGWAAEPKEVLAEEYTGDMRGDRQILVLLLYAVKRWLKDGQRIYLNEKGHKMCRDWSLLFKGRRDFFEEGDLEGIDKMIQGLDGFMEYEAPHSLELADQAGQTFLYGEGGQEKMPFDEAWSYLQARHSRKMQLALFTKELLLAYKERLGSKKQLKKPDVLKAWTDRFEEECHSI